MGGENRRYNGTILLISNCTRQRRLKVHVGLYLRGFLLVIRHIQGLSS